MAPNFVPRQRKHKVLARQKSQKSHDGNDENGVSPTEPTDPNALILPSSSTAEREARKAILRKELQNGQPKVSGKKAKRLEKYIEGKLKKDENRVLIAQLARNKTDTSLFKSSRELGRGRETKKERVARGVREYRAGVDVERNERVIFERREERDEADEDEDDDEDEEMEERPVAQEKTVEDTRKGLSQVQLGKPAPAVAVGSGLKRPLEVDDEGKPVLKKRKRKGGIKSKFTFKPKEEENEEPAWEGFSSGDEEEMDSETGSEDASADEDEDDESGDADSAESSEESEDGSDGSSESEDSASEDDTSSGDDEEAKQKRSSGFKAWAEQQRNEALGYQSVSNTPMATETPTIKNFHPRAPEQDPLPPELQITKSDRKAFAVTVTRTPEIEASRLKLPVVAEEQKIMEAIHNNPTVVIYGATGSGKTTQVPQFLYEAGYGSGSGPNPGMIGVTQPRRVAAVSMAKRVGDELGDHGKRVAYQIRFEGTTSPNTAVKFMTDGVLLREIANDFSLSKYSAIVIDEAHERSVNTDILIGMMSRIVKIRDETKKTLKLIIMSATLRITDFTGNKTLFSTPPPVLQAEGRQFTVTNHYAKKTYHDYVEEAFKKISKGHKKLPPGGFLVFLTGQNEIQQLSKRLKEAFGGSSGSNIPVRASGREGPLEAEDVDFGDSTPVVDDGDDDYDSDDSVDIEDEDEFKVNDDEEDRATPGPAKMHILPLYSLLPTREQLRIFEPPPDNSRMIVLATNVAETSLTIPGIRYVFDTGRSKERKFDQTTGVQSFEVGWISKASASQRAGRAGRTGPGHCYKLYSSAVYERDFPEFAEPEILRMSIEGVVLQLKAMNIPDPIDNFPFPTPPSKESIRKAQKLLTHLSALTASPKNTSITPFGRTMSVFPLSPRFARILLMGNAYGCIHWAIALVAGLSTGDVFIPDTQAIPALKEKDPEAIFSNADRLEEDAQLSIRREFNRVQKSFCNLDDKSDAIKLLRVLGEYAYQSTDEAEEWCQSHFVRSKPLKETLQLRRQLTDILRTNVAEHAALKYEQKMDLPKPEQIGVLKQIVASGFIDCVARRADLTEQNGLETWRKPKRAIDVPYVTLFPSNLPGRTDPDEDELLNKAVFIHPSSPLAHLSPKECPEFIVYKYLQRAATGPDGKRSRTRMHALTDISGRQLAALAKGTTLLTYGKPVKEESVNAGKTERVVWCTPFLRAEGTGGLGWPLSLMKVTQKYVSGRGWVTQ